MLALDLVTMGCVFVGSEANSYEIKGYSWGGEDIAKGTGYVCGT